MEATLRERLETIKQRYTYLEHMMTLPQVASDFNRYKLFAKEKATLETVVGLYNKYLENEKVMNDAYILCDDKDEEISKMAHEEYDIANKNCESAIKDIEAELVPKDPNDGKNVIMEIRGAAGGDEANIFAGDLFRMYERYGETQHWHFEVIEASECAAGGFSQISVMIKGKRVFSKLKYESGVHRVQRVPKTEANGRIHTSTATVLIMPEAEDVDIQLDMNDVRIDTYRSSGAGGQHINKTDSAVRMTHIPTGIVATCQSQRSQIENRAQCLLILRTRIYDEMQKEADEKRGAERRSKIGTGDRSEKIRTYNYPQNRVTDHRIGFTINRLAEVMNGDLEPIIEALTNEDQRLKIKGNSEK